MGFLCATMVWMKMVNSKASVEMIEGLLSEWHSCIGRKKERAMSAAITSRNRDIPDFSFLHHSCRCVFTVFYVTAM